MYSKSHPPSAPPNQHLTTFTALTDTDTTIICKIACCMWHKHKYYAHAHPLTHTHPSMFTRPHKYAISYSSPELRLWVWYLTWTRRRHLPIGADIPFGGRKHPGVPGHLHGAQPAPDRQSVPGLVSDCGSLRGLAGDDLCRCQRFAGWVAYP